MPTPPPSTCYRYRQSWQQQELADSQVPPAYLKLLMRTMGNDHRMLGFIFAQGTCPH
jgi:hypothetical protein